MGLLALMTKLTFPPFPLLRDRPTLGLGVVLLGFLVSSQNWGVVGLFALSLLYNVGLSSFFGELYGSIRLIRYQLHDIDEYCVRGWSQLKWNTC